jgi:hypothetical protein
VSENDARICANNDCENALKPRQKMFCSRNCANTGAKMRNCGEGECAACGASFKKYSRLQRFCQVHNRGKGKKTILRKCLRCKSHYIGIRGQKYCGTRCNAISTSPFKAKWTAGEIAYLAQQNPSFGFTNFCSTLYNRWTNKDYIFAVLEALRETNGFDYYGHLQERQGDDRPQLRVAGNGIRVKKATSPAFNWGVFADDPRVVGEEE